MSLTPALASLLNALNPTFDFVEVRISRVPGGFTLQHASDTGCPLAELDEIEVTALRGLAQTTFQGAFRPIKTAPSLRRGWHCLVASPQDLQQALDALYPGGLVDWFAAQHPPVPVQHYREFTARQTGMYRITQQLSDAEAAALIRAGCHPQFCLRKRLWTIEGLAPDDATAGKSIVPCLEPCPLLLELARRARRLDQEGREPSQFGVSEIGTLVSALNTALSHPVAGGREGDLADPANPRRIRLLRDRLARLLPEVPLIGAEE